MPTPKGVSRNPSGRPRVTPEWRAFRRRLREGADDAATELLERLRLSREATDAVAAAAAKLSAEVAAWQALRDVGTPAAVRQAETDVAAAQDELERVRKAQLSTRDYVQLVELWADRAWGRPVPVDADDELPADLRNLPALEALRQLSQRVERYQVAIAELERRTFAASPAAQQEAIADALVAAREQREGVH